MDLVLAIFAIFLPGTLLAHGLLGLPNELLRMTIDHLPHSFNSVRTLSLVCSDLARKIKGPRVLKKSFLVEAIGERVGDRSDNLIALFQRIVYYQQGPETQLVGPPSYPKLVSAVLERLINELADNASRVILSVCNHQSGSHLVDGSFLSTRLARLALHAGAQRKQSLSLAGRSLAKGLSIGSPDPGPFLECASARDGLALLACLPPHVFDILATVAAIKGNPMWARAMGQFPLSPVQLVLKTGPYSALTDPQHECLLEAVLGKNHLHVAVEASCLLRGEHDPKEAGRLGLADLSESEIAAFIGRMDSWSRSHLSFKSVIIHLLMEMIESAPRRSWLYLASPVPRHELVASFCRQIWETRGLFYPAYQGTVLGDMSEEELDDIEKLLLPYPGMLSSITIWRFGHASTSPVADS